MDILVSNWGFVFGVGSIIVFLAGIAWQTKRNARDIKQLEEDVKKSQIQTDKTIEKLFDKLEENRKELTSLMINGFSSIDNKLWGFVKEKIGSNKD